MSRRAKVYRSAVVLASALFVVMAVVGGLGLYRGDRALMHAMTVLLYAEFAVIMAALLVRGRRKKPNPR
jgi:uncharacterized membrane protein YiaA